MTGVQLVMPTCVLPGCTTPVADPTRPCEDCLTGFGDWLRESPDAVPLTPELISARDREVVAAYAAQTGVQVSTEPQRRRNQTCWLCEERRTCTHTSQGWECDTCREVS